MGNRFEEEGEELGLRCVDVKDLRDHQVERAERRLGDESVQRTGLTYEFGSHQHVNGFQSQRTR